MTDAEPAPIAPLPNPGAPSLRSGAPSRALGVVAAAFSIVPLLLAVLMLAIGINVFLTPQDSIERMNAVGILIYFALSVLPMVITLVLGVMAIVKARPRWWGIVAVVLGATPLLALAVSILLTNGLSGS
ncbi:arginine exporter protein ArgO [Microbacterium resistens]|uniref:Arginine exporter protein ArgO n=1 Tax=Microbacterium resistens TaxID=156977 RepID=A0ABU1SEZ2_9MICO|nr:hypothetical protein [Microbacterium resistens]MDR6868184.1 arginine exporter protein ArgO [Microbacterium resistens]